MRNEVKAIYQNLEKRMHEERVQTFRKEQQAILSWINSFNYGNMQSDKLARRQEGTGKWLLESKQFQKWLKADKQTIFCLGDFGTGKTVLTAIVVEHLRAQFRNDPSIGIAFIYCEYNRRKEQVIEHFLSSLLKELAQQHACLPGAVLSLYEQHKENRTRPSASELSATLMAVAGLYSRVFIVIDALDECDGGCRAKLLTNLLRLRTLKHVSIFVAARPILYIEEEFEDSIILEVQARDSDIQRYIHERLPELPRWVRRDGLQAEICHDITKSAAGMFLLAELHFNSLLGIPTLKALRGALKVLPTGSKAFDEMYEKAMERIKNQVPNETALAMQVLSWITCAERPLSTAELQHALGVEIGEKQLDEDNITPIDQMVSVCAGLVTVDGHSDIIRLMHYTTHAYLNKSQEKWFPAADVDIAEICIAYISFKEFDSGICSTDEEFEARLSSSELYVYAARNWGHHVRKVSCLVPGLLSFLDDNCLVQASIQAIWADGDDGVGMEYSQAFPRAMTGLHLTAYFGSIEAVQALLQNGVDPDPKDSYQRTPLWLAASEGHDSVVRVLIGTGRVSVNTMSIGRYTPLHIAGMNGHGSVVRLLLGTGQAVIGSKSRTGQSPLSAAASMGHTSLVEQLVRTGKFDVNGMSRSKSTPLSLAAKHGHFDVVKLLLSMSQVQPDQVTEGGRTPLSWAAGNGHESITKLLIDTNAVDVNSRDSNYGRSPLSWAAENGHTGIVRMLLKTNLVDVDSRDTECRRTPLSRASDNGHEAIVEALLDTGKVDVNSTSQARYMPMPQFNIEGGRTPLSWAAGRGHVGVVDLLLRKGSADPSLESASGRTPREWAAGNGHQAVAKLFDD
ncbi:hypothetical protein FOQG_16321 [Fusarium oxysporum f. sp. raphani 54005]|uniref:NACHT domain-containing protein n=2 Tax=Fusarium oxysporum f. sp. raphani TaxID=96318 RepID=X0BJH5_FUSOX|nr:hypothetical protein FOQG_16321 [Fusarium oxysporum f. sp. raphani 54005]